MSSYHIKLATDKVPMNSSQIDGKGAIGYQQDWPSVKLTTDKTGHW